jgi:hypothetical protein
LFYAWDLDLIPDEPVTPPRPDRHRERHA